MKERRLLNGANHCMVSPTMLIKIVQTSNFTLLIQKLLLLRLQLYKGLLSEIADSEKISPVHTI
jgi:hypothetical protein